MGLCISSTSTGSAASDQQVLQSTPPFKAEASDLEEYRLMKQPNTGCTGMFWRSDPTGKTQLESNDNWPRDGAVLRGTVVEAQGEKWLLCTHVKQKNSDWKPAPGGAAMPFKYAQYYLDK